MAQCSYESCKRDLSPSDAKRCGGCFLAAYCDAHCQRGHWRDHKDACKAEQARRSEAGADLQQNGPRDVAGSEEAARSGERERIGALSVRELRAELSRRGVPLEGLVEKRDLVDALCNAPAAAAVGSAAGAAAVPAAAPAVPTPAPRTFKYCSACRAPAARSPLSSCAGCRIVAYCSKACQEAAWRGHHKDDCPFLKNAAALGDHAQQSAAIERWRALPPAELRAGVKRGDPLAKAALAANHSARFLEEAARTGWRNPDAPMSSAGSLIRPQTSVGSGSYVPGSGSSVDLPRILRDMTVSVRQRLPPTLSPVLPNLLATALSAGGFCALGRCCFGGCRAGHH
jgi:MYND finger